MFNLEKKEFYVVVVNCFLYLFFFFLHTFSVKKCLLHSNFYIYYNYCIFSIFNNLLFLQQIIHFFYSFFFLTFFPCIFLIFYTHYEFTLFNRPCVGKAFLQTMLRITKHLPFNFSQIFSSSLFRDLFKVLVLFVCCIFSLYIHIYCFIFHLLVSVLFYIFNSLCFVFKYLYKIFCICFLLYSVFLFSVSFFRFGSTESIFFKLIMSVL